MYIVITKNQILKSNNLTIINKKLNSQLEDSEFRQIGKDKIIKLTDEDINFIQDKKKLSLIPIRNLYKKDNTLKIMLAINLILTLILSLK